MGQVNEIRKVEFKGDHEYFVEGESYTYNQYAEWTIKNCKYGGVARETIKGRLYAEPFCLIEHLAPADRMSKKHWFVDMMRENKIAESVMTEIENKNALNRIKLCSRLGTKSERLSQKWLKLPPITIREYNEWR
jgi:hypothetical protein